VSDPTTDEVVATVTVDAVTVDQACTADDATPAENGHLVGLQLRVTTGPAAPADLSLDASSFAFTAADGTSPETVATTAAAGCLAADESFPAGPLAAGQEHAGTVVLDVTGTTGTVTYRPGPDAPGGRWSF
jgi:hypothetical protein